MCYSRIVKLKTENKNEDWRLKFYLNIIVLSFILNFSQEEEEEEEEEENIYVNLDWK